MRVKVAADQSSSGQEKWKLAKIDACIADLVGALQEAGIDMRESCCGHGGYAGYIQLVDGRFLLIVSEDEARRLHDNELVKPYRPNEQLANSNPA